MMYVVEGWGYRRGGWTALSAWWSAQRARSEAENAARLHVHPFRVVDEKGEEHGRFTGEE